MLVSVEKKVIHSVVALTGPHNETERTTPCPVPRRRPRPPRAVKAAYDFLTTNPRAGSPCRGYRRRCVRGRPTGSGEDGRAR
jgi:hypothetical protein